MPKPIITVEHLSKKYTIGENLHGRGARTFRDLFDRKLRSIFRGRGEEAKQENVIWALNDVSFEVCEGEVLGIIGRNGAGKSTLLKILSRITEPTKGKVTLCGRVTSLLEVGTGFNMELTGRENIYLNGAILGMRKTEIDRKFDEIVDFAEIERFIDTPVKRYSSGMYLRLAFAVAAHLDTEILLVDEVLSVGDMKFQKKCLGKIKSFENVGRTVLLVSHYLTAIQQLCNRCLLLHAGQIQCYDHNVSKVLDLYIRNNEANALKGKWENTANDFLNDFFLIKEFYIADKDGNSLHLPVKNDADMCVCIKGTVLKESDALTFAYNIYSEDNTLFYHTATHDITDDIELLKFKEGDLCLLGKIPNNMLNEGIYKVELNIFLHGELVLIHTGNNAPMITLEIEGGLSKSTRWLTKRAGILAPVIKWIKL